MKTYQSKSSIFVKIATASILILVTLIAIMLTTTDKSYGLIGGVILSLLIFGSVIYFYSNSLKKIVIEKDFIILQKNIGQIKILKVDIIEVSRLSYSNLTMTYGSKGFFGFIGKTMDDSISLVKDRKNMLRITTKNKRYLFSSLNSDQLVQEMKRIRNN
ncbi:PH domain-containing protein [Mesonia sediminis]|uniref:PH domain-containing protein n=1 Tax=Mesonia sediminis TaxID=1703946 RepID=A0ABW5SGF1_9FLAO